MSQNGRSNDDLQGCLWAVSVVFCGVLISAYVLTKLGYEPPPKPEPKPRPRAEQVGEAVGDKATRFAGGVLQGVKKNILKKD